MDKLIAFAFFAAIGIFFAYKFAALFLAQTDMLYSDYRSAGGRGDMRRFAKKLRKKKLATVALSLAHSSPQYCPQCTFSGGAASH